MSRALILMATARFKGSPLTPEEVERCLQAWRDIASEKFIRVPKQPRDDAEIRAKVDGLHAAGMTVRVIAKKVGWSKSQVHRYLSQKSSIPIGQIPVQPEITETG